jgi:hypothetical protein
MFCKSPATRPGFYFPNYQFCLRLVFHPAQLFSGICLFQFAATEYFRRGGFIDTQRAETESFCFPDNALKSGELCKDWQRHLKLLAMNNARPG